VMRIGGSPGQTTSDSEMGSEISWIDMVLLFH
jgi:hypothetical protein